MTPQLLSTWHPGTEEHGRGVFVAHLLHARRFAYTISLNLLNRSVREVSLSLALCKRQSGAEGPGSQAPGAPRHLRSPKQTLDVDPPLLLLGGRLCAAPSPATQSHRKADERRCAPQTSAASGARAASSFRPHAPRGPFHLPACQAAPLSRASFLPPWSFFNKTFHSLEKHLP